MAVGRMRGAGSLARDGSPGEAARPDRIDEWLEVCGRGLPARGELDELAHETKRSSGPLAKTGGPAQVDGLGCDEQFEGDDACGEVDHFGEAPRRKRGHCRAVLDPFSLARAHDLEGDR